MGVTAVGGANGGLNARAATFAESTVIKCISGHHVDVFHQDRLITLTINFHIKLIFFRTTLCKRLFKMRRPELQDAQSEHQSYYLHRIVYKQWLLNTNAATLIAKYKTAPFECLNKATVYLCESDVY